MATNGIVIFAKQIDKMSKFYQHVLNAEVAESANSHVVLSAKGVEVVIHGIPKDVASSIAIDEPPQLRAAAVFKPVFTIESLAHVRKASNQYGGGLKAMTDAWDIRGAIVLDGWDPEGNVIQFKEVAS